MTFSLTLHEAIGVLCYRQSIYENTYMDLTKHFKCYSFILPADKKLIDEIFCIPPLQSSALASMNFYCWCTLMENHFLPSEQLNIVRHLACSPSTHHRMKQLQQISQNLMYSQQEKSIQDSSISHTHLSSQFTRVLGALS